MPCQIEHHLATVCTGEVQSNAFLACIDPREIGALVAAARLELVHHGASLVTSASALDFDNACTHVGQQPGAVGACEHTRKIDDGDTSERERIVLSLHARIHLPLNCGSLRSAIALIPSAQSSVARCQVCSISSRSVEASIASTRPRRIVSRVDMTASGAD